MKLLAGFVFVVFAMTVAVPRGVAQTPNPAEQQLIILENDWSQGR